MRKSKEIANEICVFYADAKMQNDWQLFTKKLSEVFMELAVKDIQELRQLRNVKTDNGLISIFREQRQKYGAICKIVNTVKGDLLFIGDFDNVIKEVHPSIYEWYVRNVVAQYHG